MPETEHAIVVSPAGEAWEWRLIDLDGGTFASGSASTQEGAMSTAWGAARRVAASSRGYPEVIVSHGAPA